MRGRSPFRVFADQTYTVDVDDSSPLRSPCAPLFSSPVRQRDFNIQATSERGSVEFYETLNTHIERKDVRKVGNCHNPAKSLVRGSEAG